MSRSCSIRFEIIFQINDWDKVTDWDILVHTLALGSFIERFGLKKLQHEIGMGLEILKTFKHSVHCWHTPVQLCAYHLYSSFED